MIFQQTLKCPVRIQGTGLHSGKPATLVLRPAHPNHGISFVRTDLEGSPEIPALHARIVNTRLATTLGNGKATVSTVEHVMAAFQGLGVDNAVVEIDGPEVPILDGSAAPFAESIRSVGLVAQAMFRPVLRLRRKVEVRVNEKWAVAEPNGRLEVFGSIEWDHPAIGYQEFHWIEGKTRFEEIASARTFCLLRDVETMQRMGLARGGSLDNAVVMDEASVLNPGGLRYPDELARHKVLDALGDFKLAGVPLQAFVRLHRAGHELHGQLLEAILGHPENYEIIGSPVEREQRMGPQLGALADALVASVS